MQKTSKRAGRPNFIDAAADLSTELRSMYVACLFRPAEDGTGSSTLKRNLRRPIQNISNLLRNVRRATLTPEQDRKLIQLREFTKQFRQYFYEGDRLQAVPANYREAIATWAREMQRLRKSAKRASSPASEQPTHDHGKELLVTVNDIAKLIGLERKSMARYEKRFPNPIVTARGRRAARWYLTDIISMFEKEFPRIPIRTEALNCGQR